jgi:hypothetical protein
VEFLRHENIPRGVPQLLGERGSYFFVGDLDSNTCNTGRALGFHTAQGEIPGPKIAKVAFALQLLAQPVE